MRELSKILLIIFTLILISACVPEDEFLPKEVQSLGAAGLKAQQEEDAAAKALAQEQDVADKAKQEEEKLTDTAESGIVPISDPTIDDIFGGSVRKLSYNISPKDGGALLNGTVDDLKRWMDYEEKESVLESAQNFVSNDLNFYFYGLFNVGDKIILFPNRDCSVTSANENFVSELEIEVTTAHLAAMFSIGQDPEAGVGVTHVLTGAQIDEGEFYPTVKYSRVFDGELKTSKCYNISSSPNSLIKDTISPLAPKTISLVNPIGSTGVATIEVHSNADDVSEVQFYKNGTCDETESTDLIGTRRFGLSSIVRFNYSLEESEKSTTTEFGELSFSAKYKDKAGNIGPCSNSVSYIDVSNMIVDPVLSFETTGVDANDKAKDLLGDGSLFVANFKPNSLLDIGDAPPEFVSVRYYTQADCRGEALGSFEQVTAKPFLKDLSCSENQECIFSAQVKTIDGRKICSNTVKLFIDKTPPVINIVEDNVSENMQFSATENTTTVVVGAKEIGLRLSLDDHLRDYLGSPGFFKVEAHKNDTCNDFNQEREISSFDQNEIKISTDINFEENIGIKVIDPIGNESDCLFIRQLFFEESEIEFGITLTVGNIDDTRFHYIERNSVAIKSSEFLTADNSNFDKFYIFPVLANLKEPRFPQNITLLLNNALHISSSDDNELIEAKKI